ncbi:MAG: M23 family metallopeptidase [Muribaculaceae bacterium]|nr:M23 family metallopeptidase [Muribaculaceae bacterium]
MARKVYYKYNPTTDSYDRVYPTARQRAWIVARQFIFGILFGIVLFVVAYYTLEFPKEKALRAENERLRVQYQMLGKQADEAFAVMEDLAERDNNFYRVMLQADPISSAQRYAGLERERQSGQLSDDELALSVANKLDRLDKQVYMQIKSYDELRQLALSQKDKLDHMPAIQPISERYLKTMASGYGYRVDPVYGTQKFHEGMDFSSDIGTPVYATGKGVVSFAGWKSGYGNCIDIDHGYNYTTRYAHLSEIKVRAGQQVERGEEIGLVGNTGKSTGPHLHYEVRLRGAPQNPVNYYFYDLTPAEYDEMIREAENAGHVMD